jgi:Holliday junction resolvasome RuvABC endonuclease subunit
LSVRRDESSGMRLMRLRENLSVFEATHGIDLIAFEASRNSKFGNAVRVAGAIQGVVELWCLDHNVQYKGYSATTIKKHACNYGQANKEKMIAAARAKWPGVPITSEDQADAMWVLDHACQDLGLPAPKFN